MRNQEHSKLAFQFFAPKVLISAYKPVAPALVLGMSLLLSACGSGGGESASENLDGLAQANSQLAEPAVGTDSRAQTENQPSSLRPVGDCELSELDQQLLTKINQVRATARACGEQTFQAAGPVVWNCTLEGAAQAHSQDMGDNNFFSHTGSDGLRVGARADIAGYDWLMVGENIAVGYSSVDAVVNAWLDSPSHCSTIMESRYTEMANALYLPSAADYSTYWTLLMGKPTAP